MLARPAASLLLASILLLPVASAFSARHDLVELAYDAAHAPVVISVGALDLRGDVRDGIVLSGVGAFELQRAPHVTVTERVGDGVPANQTFADATLRVESGTVLWKLASGSILRLRADAPYGMGLALTETPLPRDDGASPGAGALIVSPELEANGAWPDASTDVLVLHATVSLVRADGVDFPGWSHREVNAGSPSVQDANEDTLNVVFHTDGALEMAAKATMIAGAVGSNANMTLGVSRADQDRFTATLDVLDSLGHELGAQDKEGSPFGGDNPLKNLSPFSGVLNGAMLVVSGPGEGSEAPPTPIAAKMGDEPFDVGPISLLRSGDMELRWSGTEMRVQGEPAVAVGKSGFAVAPTASIGGIVPILSVILWIGAIAAIVVYFVKRPPKAKVSWSFRFLGWGIWLLVLLVVFLVWDASFADTFGTSVATLLKSGNRDVQQLGAVFGIEMVPWTLAGILFALPVRIMLGVGFRYLGKGASFSSVAKAGGLVALAILGPVYALWMVNIIIQKVVEAMSGSV